MGKTFLYRLSVITIILAITLIGYFSYLLLWPFTILKLEEGYGQTIKTTYYSGEVLTYKNHFTKYKALTATVIQAFVDGIVFQLPERQTDNAVGHQEFINMSVRIPESLPSGKYHLNTTIVYKVNILRDIRYSNRSNDFMVINPQQDTMKGLYGSN